MVQPLIQFKDVFKKFGDSRVLQGVSLCIYRGEITTIIGKSGEGKSVLLKHMIGLMHPDAGEIVLDGRPLSKMKLSEIDKLRGKFSYVFQDAALFDSRCDTRGRASSTHGSRRAPKSLGSGRWAAR